MGPLLHTTLAFFTPESGGSPQADHIDSLYKIELYIALVIFVAVEGALLYALIRFRARKHAVPAQIRGNTRLEIGWTVAAAVILVALAVITFVKLAFESVGLDAADHVAIDRSLFRPTDIASNRGNPQKALKQLMWRAHYKMHDVVRMMVAEEHKSLDRQAAAKLNSMAFDQRFGQ